MKQTFNIPEGCTKVTIEQIGNKIVTEFEPGSEFKAGDVIFEDGRIIIYKSYRDNKSFNIYALICYSIDRRVSYGGYYGTSMTGCRLATNKEKQLLFDALAKEGKQWNAETLQIEDLKVEPKVGDCVKATYRSGNVFLGIFKNIDEVERLRQDGEIKEGCFETYDSIKILTRSQFQSEVNALGFEYDFDTDTFKEMEWKPKKGEMYYSFGGKNSTRWNNDEFDKFAFEAGFVFKTKQERDEAIEKIKNILKSK